MPKISVVIITKNEEHNIERAINSVLWANEILVVDSESTDQTCAIAEKAGARVIKHSWPGYGQQKNFALKQVKFDWVLSLDADEEITPESKTEIEQAIGRAESEGITGFYLPRKTFYMGKWIRYGGWYPNYLVRLGRRDSGEWTTPPVHESWETKGPRSHLHYPILHYTFDDIEDQVITNVRYAGLGAESCYNRRVKPNLFKLIFKPLWKFLQTYFLKRGILDGLPGLIISLNAAHSQFLKYAFLYEKTLGLKRQNARLNHRQ